MSASWAVALLYTNLVAHALLLAGVVWCIALPGFRIDPMSKANGWYYAMWVLFGFIFAANPLFVLLDRNHGPWTSTLRFWLEDQYGTPSIGYRREVPRTL